MLCTHRFEQGLGVCYCAAGHQLNAWDGLEVGLQTLAVLCAQLPAHTSGTTHHHWHLELTTTGVVEHTAVVGDLKAAGKRREIIVL